MQGGVRGAQCLAGFRQQRSRMPQTLRQNGITRTAALHLLYGL